MKRIFKAIELAEVYILSFSILLMAVLLIVNVFGRIVGASLGFVEEVCQMLLIITSFIGLPYCVTKSKHINMSILIDFSSDKVRKVLYIIISAIAMLFMLYMTKASFNYVLSLKNMGRTTVVLKIPVWTYSALIPAGFFLAAVEYLRTLIMNFKHWKTVFISPEITYAENSEMPREEEG